MGEFHQVRRPKPRPMVPRPRRTPRVELPPEVVDLAAWKRRRKAEEAGRYGARPGQRRRQGLDDDGGWTA